MLSGGVGRRMLALFDWKKQMAAIVRGQMAAVCFLSGRSFQNPYLAQSTLRMSPVALKAVWKASEASSEWGMLPFLLSRR